MRKVRLGYSVFDAAVRLMAEVYQDGHTVVVCMSGGKDSGACLEIAIKAAEMTGNLPVKAVTRDEEICFPGTYDYLERAAARPEVDMAWLVANQPVVNVFNRANPYFWVFDPQLDPDEWVRKPPEWATYIKELNIDAMVHPSRYSVAEGKCLIAVIGLRVSESARRLMGLASSGGHMTAIADRAGVPYRTIRPIYDWQDGDIWKAHIDHGWDYNIAYDQMHRIGMSRKALRIGPPTMTPFGADALRYAAMVWPKWFDRLCNRLKGVRQAAQFGKLVAMPRRRKGETWEECFKRLCIDEAPAEWIRERAETAMKMCQKRHSLHAPSTSIPETIGCIECGNGNLTSWRALTEACFNGDPFSLRLGGMGLSRFPYLEPEFFREGAGTWGGVPSF